MPAYQKTTIKWPNLMDECKCNNDSDDDDDDDDYIAFN
jgi:hypothetical protein